MLNQWTINTLTVHCSWCSLQNRHDVIFQNKNLPDNYKWKSRLIVSQNSLRESLNTKKITKIHTITQTPNNSNVKHSKRRKWRNSNVIALPRIPGPRPHKSAHGRCRFQYTLATSIGLWLIKNVGIFITFKDRRPCFQYFKMLTAQGA